MKSCPKMVDAGRRKFLTGVGVTAAGVAAATVAPSTANALPARARNCLTTPPYRCWLLRSLPAAYMCCASRSAIFAPIGCWSPLRIWATPYYAKRSIPRRAA